MSRNRIGLAPGPYLHDYTLSQDTRTGAESEMVWEGSGSEILLAKQVAIAAGASSISIKPMGDGNFTMRATYPWDQNGNPAGAGAGIPSIFELETETSQVLVWMNQKLNNIFTPPQLADLFKVVQNFNNGSYPNPTQLTANPSWRDNPSAYRFAAEADALTVGGAYGLKLFKSIAYRGMDSSYVFNTIFKRTLTAATPNQIRASFTGAGMIWTTSEVTAFEGLDPNGWFVLPSYFETPRGAPPAMQWLKTMPNVAAVAHQKTQVQYSYVACRQASGFLYEPYNSAILLDYP